MSNPQERTPPATPASPCRTYSTGNGGPATRPLTKTVAPVYVCGCCDPKTGFPYNTERSLIPEFQKVALDSQYDTDDEYDE